MIILALALAVNANAYDCVPRFYQVLPRDSDYYYAAGKGSDANEARAKAAEALTVTITASTRYGTAAGYEQDDHSFCDGQYYVLIRVEKGRVRSEAIVADKISDKVDVFGKIVDIHTSKLEMHKNGMNDMDSRLSRLENSNPAPVTIYSTEKTQIPIPQATMAMLDDKLKPQMIQRQARIDSGLYSQDDVLFLVLGYNTYGNHKGLLEFCSKVLSGNRRFETGIREWMISQCGK